MLSRATYAAWTAGLLFASGSASHTSSKALRTSAMFAVSFDATAAVAADAASDAAAERRRARTSPSSASDASPLLLALRRSARSSRAFRCSAAFSFASAALLLPFLPPFACCCCRGCFGVEICFIIGISDSFNSFKTSIFSSAGWGISRTFRCGTDGGDICFARFAYLRVLSVSSN